MKSARSVIRISVQLPAPLKVEHQQDQRAESGTGIQQVTARELLRLAIDLAGKLAIGDDRTSEGHSTDEDAEEDLDLQNGDFGPVFSAIFRAKPAKSANRFA